MATVATPITAEDLLAMPDDGMERWLVNGELKERPMTRRNRFHCRVMTCVATELEIWSRQQPEPRGQVLTGDAGVRFSRAPETAYGVDLVYVSAEVMARQTEESTIVDGAPTLAVEILSPNDVVEDVDDKIDAFLAAGVPLVWIISPRRRTVTVHAPGAEPVTFGVRGELSGEPHLPGLRVPVTRLFD